MPKHALGPTREKLFGPPNVAGSAALTASSRRREANLDLSALEASRGALHECKALKDHITFWKKTPSSGALSNEVLLRSKIAQLEGKTNVRGRATTKTGSKPVAHGGHALAGEGRSRCGGKGGSGTDGKGTGKNKEAAVAGGGRTARKARNEGDVMRRFEDQVISAGRGFDSDCASSQRPWHGLAPEGMKVLRDMYVEQVRTTRAMTKQTQVLAGKMRTLETSTANMRNENEHCVREVARLEQAASKLQTLGVVLNNRRTSMLDEQAVAAAKEAATREELNVSLNTVVRDMTAKITEQEKARIAQDEENAKLHQELEALLERYDESKNILVKALKDQEDKKAVLAQRLEELTVAAEASATRENGLASELEEVSAAEEVLKRRVGEHRSRLERQETGLKSSLDAIKRLQTESGPLRAALDRLSREKTALVGRTTIGRDSSGTSGGGDGEEEPQAEKSGALQSVSVEELERVTRENVQRATELENKKVSLQTRCRKLQAERTQLAKEVTSMQLDASPAIESPPNPDEVKGQGEGEGQETSNGDVDVHTILEAPVAASDDVADSIDS